MSLEHQTRTWHALQLQRALLSGYEIAMLKALGWTPVGEPKSALTGQDIIDAGERWWIEERNARGWLA